ncbi:MAG: hypothetical protein R6V58_12850 [Planctomycetota bacterium]
MCIVQSPKELERIRRMLRQAPLVALRERLTDRLILAACRECGHRFRERRYGPVVTVLHFLAQALQREESFAATWQDLWTPLAAACPDRWILAFSRRMAAAATLRLLFLYDRLLDAVASTPSMFDLDAWNPAPLCGNANITRVGEPPELNGDSSDSGGQADA